MQLMVLVWVLFPINELQKQFSEKSKKLGKELFDDINMFILLCTIMALWLCKKSLYVLEMQSVQ